MLRNLKPHLQYLWYLLRHKWFVFVAGRKTGAPLWRLLIHDWTKFTPAEWPAYVQKFYGTRKHLKDYWPNHGTHCGLCLASRRIKWRFDAAWEHHYQHNAHHWEFWLTHSGYAYQMPQKYIREMVADWAGAGRAITRKWSVREWYLKNAAKMNLHEYTRCYAEYLLQLHF